MDCSKQAARGLHNSRGRGGLVTCVNGSVVNSGIAGGRNAVTPRVDNASMQQTGAIDLLRIAQNSESAKQPARGEHSQTLKWLCYQSPQNSPSSQS